MLNTVLCIVCEVCVGGGAGYQQNGFKDEKQRNTIIGSSVPIHVFMHKFINAKYK